jgi:hypothetical protein
MRKDGGGMGGRQAWEKDKVRGFNDTPAKICKFKIVSFKEIKYLWIMSRNIDTCRGI